MAKKKMKGNLGKQWWILIGLIVGAIVGVIGHNMVYAIFGLEEAILFLVGVGSILGLVVYLPAMMVWLLWKILKG